MNSHDPQLDPRHEISRWTGYHTAFWFLQKIPRNCLGNRIIASVFDINRSYGPEGRGFESLTAYQKTDVFSTRRFFVSRLRREQIKYIERGLPSPLELAPCEHGTLRKSRSFIRLVQKDRIKILPCQKTPKPCGFQGCFGSHRSSLEIFLHSSESDGLTGLEPST